MEADRGSIYSKKDKQKGFESTVMGTEGKPKQQTDERAHKRTNERTSERTVKRANERTNGLNLVRLLLLLLCFCALLLLLCMIGIDVRQHIGLNFVCAQCRRAIRVTCLRSSKKGCVLLEFQWMCLLWRCRAETKKESLHSSRSNAQLSVRWPVRLPARRPVARRAVVRNGLPSLWQAAS